MFYGLSAETLYSRFMSRMKWISREQVQNFVYIVGSNADQNSVAPAVTLGSVVIDLPHAFIAVAREVKNGTFAPRVITLDTRSAVMKWTVNPAMTAVIPARTMQMVDSITRTMFDGTFTPPYPPRPPEGK